MKLWLWWIKVKQWLTESYAERQRRIDLEVLWPAVKREAFHALPKNYPELSEPQILELARESFITHMANDPSWRSIADDWSAEQLGKFVRTNLV